MNKTIRKIFICMLSCSMIAGMMTVNVSAGSTEKYKKEIETLTKLNIITGYSSENYITKKSITTSDYISLVMKMVMRSNLSGDLVQIAKLWGLADEDDGLSSATPVSFEQAVKIAVRALGYETWVKCSGKGYTAVASEIGLLKGIPYTETDKLTSDSMLSILYNMLDVETLEAVYNSGNVEYKNLGGTILEENLGLIKGEGIVTSNEFTGLYDADDGIVGHIGIDDELYEISDGSANDYLGMNVEFYYSNGNGENEIFCVVQDNNSEITVQSDMLESGEENITRLDYYRSENQSTVTKVKLSQNLKLIYNGKVISKYDASDFEISDGNIRLVDNNNDKEYDIAFVTEYELVKVNKVNVSENTIYNEYKNTDSKLNFDESEYSGAVFVYVDGVKSEFSAIPSDSIILMEKSKTGYDGVTKLYVSTKKASGTVTQLRLEDSEIVCGENVFKLNCEYIKVLQSGDVNVQKLKLGNTYDFYLDAEGKISGAVLNGSVRDEEYILVYKVINVQDDEYISLKYVNEDDEHKITPISNKVRIDGKSFNGAAQIYKEIKNIHAEIVEVSYDSDGSIKTLNRAELRTDKTEADTFNYMPKTQLTYRSGAGTTTLGGVYYLDAETDLYVVYDINGTDEEDYAKMPLSRVVLSDSETKLYTVTPYNIDAYGFASIILVEATQGTKNLSMVVGGFSDSIDTDGDVQTTLNGYVGSLVDVEVPAKNSNVFDGIGIGDFVTVTINGDGEATGYSLIYSPEWGRKYEYYMPHTVYHATRFAGDVEIIDYEKERFRMSMGNLGKKTCDYQWMEPTVYIYEDKTVSFGTADDINVGDFVVVTTSYDRPSTIVIYR